MGTDAFELRIKDLLVAILLTEATEILDGNVMIQKGIMRMSGQAGWRKDGNHGIKLWQ
jgi:hypothetical protein